MLHTFNSVIVCHTECGKDFSRRFVLIRLLDSVEKAPEPVCLSLHYHSLPLRSIIPQPPHPPTIFSFQIGLLATGEPTHVHRNQEHPEPVQPEGFQCTHNTVIELLSLLLF